MPLLDQLLSNDYGLIVAGLVLLALGAEVLVHGAVSLALRLRVSPLLIGVTIVAWGTSTPELLVSVNASMNGNYGLAVGNVVGSNIFNILLILGVAAVISPIAVSSRSIGRDGLFALAAAGLFAWIALRMNVMGFAEGVLFLAVLLAMVVFSYGQESSRPEGEAVASEAPEHSVLIDILLIGTGLGLLVIGADMLVHGSVSDCARFRRFRRPSSVSALLPSVPSVPELATSIVAALPRQGGYCPGQCRQARTSTTYLASSAWPHCWDPFSIDSGDRRRIDMWVMIAATLALFPPLASGGQNWSALWPAAAGRLCRPMPSSCSRKWEANNPTAVVIVAVAGFR
jgi:cation:H+ antiporter